MVGETVAAPYRLAQVRLSNAIHTTVGVGHDVAHAALGPARSAVTQLHAATHARHLDDSTLRVMADGSGDTNDAFVRGVYRAADDDSVSSYGQIDRAVERIDDLDGAAQTRAKRLVADTDGDEIWLIDDIDSSTLERVTGLNIERADELRAAFATKRSQGHAILDDIDAFAEYVDNLEGITGLNSGPVDGFIRAHDFGNVKGALQEVRRADEIGADNIQRMNLEVYDGKVPRGELDIQKTSGEIVESKSSFGFTSDEIDRQFERKLTTMRDHEDVVFDGNTLEVQATNVQNQRLVSSGIAEWEHKVASQAEWNNADITIKVVDESSGNIIEG